MLIYSANAAAVQAARARHVLLSGVVAGALLSAAPALARTEAGALVDQHHCMFCHTNDSPFLAPSFQQIADRYRDDPKAQAMLEHKVRVGGRAHWGNISMPPPPERGGSVSAEDAHTLVQWVLRH